MNTQLKILKQIALQAGEIVKRGYSAQKEIQHKGIVDLVTQYDLKTEQFIIVQLQIHFSDYTLIGEELFAAFLGVPIIHHREVLGVLVVQQQQRRRFDESEESFLVTKI